MSYILKYLGEGWSFTYSNYNETILSFGRQQWMYVLIAFAVFGCFCMRGMHRRI